MKNPVILTCAITGAETQRDRQPNLPITPKEQAHAAAECVRAGASIIHLHVREDDGKPSQRIERFRESISAIRAAAPGVIIQISTGGAIGESIENRMKPIELKPEMASLNLGSMNFGEDIFLNHPNDIAILADKMKKFSVVPELEIYETGMLENAFRLRKKGVLQDPMHFQFVLGVPGGMSGELFNLRHLLSVLKFYSVDELPHWGVAGVGRFQLPVAELALSLGGHVRVGFEDCIYFEKGVLGKSNAQFVERIARMAQEMGREVATCEQTRKLLKLGA